MKPIIAAAAIALLAGGTAIAQPAGTATTTTTTTVTKKTTITPSEEPMIKEYVVKEHRPSIPPPAGFEVAPGAVVPPAVALYPFPENVAWHNYNYAVIGGETVVVDPATRHIVTVIR